MSEEKNNSMKIDPEEVTNSWRKIYDWKKAEFSDLVKAKKVVTDKTISLKELQGLTKIPYNTLSNSRYHPDSLDNAKGETINKLAQAYSIFNLKDMSEAEMDQIYEDILALFNKLDAMDLTDEQSVILLQALNYLTIENRAEATYKIKQGVKALKQSQKIRHELDIIRSNKLISTKRKK